MQEGGNVLRPRQRVGFVGSTSGGNENKFFLKQSARGWLRGTKKVLAWHGKRKSELGRGACLAWALPPHRFALRLWPCLLQLLLCFLLL